jgi:xylulokinase
VGQDPANIYAVGGGTKNRVWAQATSDISGRPQVVREKTIGASYGDAFLAAMAVGDVEPADIEQWNPIATTFAPDPALRDRYVKLYGIFRDLYPATRKDMAALGSI